MAANTNSPLKWINAPSLANCSFLSFGDELDKLAQGGAQWFHVDIMDGHYVPNLCFPVRLVAELKRAYPEIACDVHLMVDRPMEYLGALKENGADYVSFHLDATPFALRALSGIRALGMKAGVVINPSQRVDSLEPVLHLVDYVVLMTVEPGYAGQRFMPEGIARLRELASLREKNGRDFLISIDGGVDMENAVRCAKLGAEVFVTGVYTVFNQEDGIACACKRFMDTLARAACDNRFE